MTHTHYISPDKIVEVITTTDDNRFPRHDTPMAILKLHPKPHSRCREQWGGVTFMINFDELKALLEAIQSCDPTFHFTISKEAQVKPESRRLWWKKANQSRVNSKQRYARR